MTWNPEDFKQSAAAALEDEAADADTLQLVAAARNLTLT